ncbi:hypothetical protein F511_45510 [Dorcoceras hygrometricum]|uniref:Uncharacterized protein n=1 Tax=Dorcoceras hygrometricum TaxID=472368 RepID=A0A2Z6ZVU5_9LAMI|nr:hypothetical protein F511_45510 [Dorcoceras hygrometricum]
MVDAVVCAGCAKEADAPPGVASMIAQHAQLLRRFSSGDMRALSHITADGHQAMAQSVAPRSAHVGACERRACSGRARFLLWRARRPAAAPAKLRRCRDG